MICACKKRTGTFCAEKKFSRRVLFFQWKKFALVMYYFIYSCQYFFTKKERLAEIHFFSSQNFLFALCTVQFFYEPYIRILINTPFSLSVWKKNSKMLKKVFWKILTKKDSRKNTELGKKFGTLFQLEMKENLLRIRDEMCQFFAKKFTKPKKFIRLANNMKNRCPLNEKFMNLRLVKNDFDMFCFASAISLHPGIKIHFIKTNRVILFIKVHL